MSKVIEISKLIERSPETCGNRPRIAGTRITVGRIATLWKQGVNPEEMVDNWDYLTLAQVYAALAYYHANKEEIEGILAADAAECDRLEARFSEATSV